MSGDQLCERLKEQVSASIQDALSKATSVLSNLHRVQSYLDVFNSLPSSRAGDVVNSAIEQVKGMRADAATLLQTVYLTEIGLQSLQEFGKDDGDVVFGLTHDQSDLSFMPNVDEEEEPLPKKLKLGVTITSCVSCKRKFAHQSPDDSSALCRVCRDEPLGKDSPSPKKPVAKVTPRKKRRGGLTPQKCGLCGATFVYRRCLLRHIKENHSECDNPEQHIQLLDPVDSSGAQVHMISAEDPVAVEHTIDSNGAAMATEYKHSLSSPLTQQQGDQDNSFEAIETLDGGKYAVVTINGDKMYKCLLCSKAFNRPYRIQRHLETHNPSRAKVQCHICNKSFTRMDTLQSHIRCVHSNERPFVCTFEGCDKKFPLQSGLVHHLKSHMDGKPYKCQECTASFALIAEFKGHLNSDHADTKNMRCSDCFKVFTSIDSLQQHRTLEHRLECEICSKTFTKLGFLQTHVEIHNGTSLFNCRFCNAGFDNEYSYKQHVKTHPKYNRVRKSHPCPVCGDSFLDGKDLMSHYQSEGHRDKVKTLGLSSATVFNAVLSEDLNTGDKQLTEEALIQSMSANEAFQTAITVETMDSTD